MQNLKGTIQKYLSLWLMIMVQPILFYTKLKEEDWRGEPLTFLLVISWVLGLTASLVVFIVQYVPVGATLVEGLAGYDLLLTSPVLVTLAFVFFMITLLIVGGAFCLGFFFMFYIAGAVFHYVYMFLGGKGSMNRMIQNMFYSSAAFINFLLLFALMLVSKYGGLSFDLFRVGFDVIYFFTVLYLYGLWAIAGRKVYGVPKWKAFLGAVVPVIVLLIFGVLFDKIALSKLQPWIS